MLLRVLAQIEYRHNVAEFVREELESIWQETVMA
jgi:hypothetical protein